jgi:hypothetical protein
VTAAFWSRVRVGEPDECWPWLGCTRGKTGYGAVGSKGKVRSTHRVAYELVNGPIPPGLLVRHRCDNRICCNPAHLELGTHKQNHTDMVERGRAPVQSGPKPPHRSGETHGQARLTQAQVDEIRRRAAKGETDTALAREFGVGRTAINRIRHGVRWRTEAA